MTPSPRTTVLISATELYAQLSHGHRLVLVDVPGGERQERIPGAARVDWRRELAGSPTAESGATPLPDPEEFERSVRSWGVNDDSQVVVYGDRPLPMAARAWFLLRWAGLRSVRHLDGGWDAWVAAGGSTTTRETVIAPGSFHIAPGSWPVLSAADAAGLTRRGTLLDARGPADYAGDTAGGGHIPGAVNVPYADTIDDSGRLLPEAQLRARFEAAGALGDAPLGAYCGGGTAASHHALALAALGVQAPVYVDSWSGWTKDPARPVSRGTTP